MTPQQWWSSLPFTSRLLFLSTLALAAFVTYSPLQADKLWFQLPIQQQEYWRLYTSLFYCGGLALSTVLHISVFVVYSRDFELSFPNSARGCATYFMLFVSAAVTSLIAAYTVSAASAAPTLLFTLLTLWSNTGSGSGSGASSSNGGGASTGKKAEETAAFLSFEIKRKYHVWLLFVLFYIFKVSFILCVSGIVCGCVLLLLHGVLPRAIYDVPIGMVAAVFNAMKIGTTPREIWRRGDGKRVGE